MIRVEQLQKLNFALLLFSDINNGTVNKTGVYKYI
jgi:hypothetical protein